jgi:hypothetical protein
LKIKNPAASSGVLEAASCDLANARSPGQQVVRATRNTARRKRRGIHPKRLTLEEKLKNVRQAGVIMLQGRRELENDLRLVDYGIRWFTFAGNMLNLSVADAIRHIGFENVSVSDFWIRVSATTDNERLFSELDQLSPQAIRTAFRIPEDFLKQLKFNECLPPRVAEEMLKDRLIDLGLLEKLLTTSRRTLLD